MPRDKIKVRLKDIYSGEPAPAYTPSAESERNWRIGFGIAAGLITLMAGAGIYSWYKGLGTAAQDATYNAAATTSTIESSVIGTSTPDITLTLEAMNQYSTQAAEATRVAIESMPTHTPVFTQIANAVTPYATQINDAAAPVANTGEGTGLLIYAAILLCIVTPVALFSAYQVLRNSRNQ